MRLTERDQRLLRDVALSQILSRDQILKLGYFGSVTRANTRLRALTGVNFLDVCATPFFGQHLYTPGSAAKQVVGERLGALISKREQSPRFVQHALAVTNVRIAFQGQGSTAWRFEGQLRHRFLFAGCAFEIRPDGFLKTEDTPLVIEVDLGHVAPKKFLEKLRAYEAFVDSGEAKRLWRVESLHLITFTTGNLRRSRLSSIAAPHPSISYAFKTFSEFGVDMYGGWS